LTLEGILDIDSNEQYQDFMLNAQELQDDDAVISLREVIKILRPAQNPAYPLPFCFLEGSSGLGKTQMALTLMGTTKQRVFYLLANLLSESSQQVYQAFRRPSDFLIECVRKDLDVILSANKMLSLEEKLDVARIKDRALYTFCFIKTLVENGYSGQHRVSPIRVDQLADVKISNIRRVYDVKVGVNQREQTASECLPVRRHTADCHRDR
jgi:hypothetical protein